MEHYETLLFKGLINGGGSSSETYSCILLTGDFDRMVKLNQNIQDMWDYLDKPLQALVITILQHCDSRAPMTRTETDYPRYFVDRMARMAAYAKCALIDNYDEVEQEEAVFNLIITTQYSR